MAIIYRVPFVGPTLAAGDKKTCVLVAAPSGEAVALQGAHVFCDGNVAADKLLRVEVIRAASDGTGTSITIRHQYGHWTSTPRITAKENYTAEPGTITACEPVGLAPSGAIDRPEIEGEQLWSDLAKFIGLRIENLSGNSSVTPRGTIRILA